MIIDALNNESHINHMEDVVVPRAAIPSLLRGIKDLSDERWGEFIPGLREQIYTLTLSLGGTITAEHGIGATRRDYLPLALDQVQIDLMRRIRDCFDPHHILNPGKIFP
jgi:glycolate oxidase